jgi:hypothetical protein
MVKSEAKAGLHQQKDNKKNSKPVQEVVMPSLAIRDLESRQFGLGALEGVFSSVAKTASKAAPAAKNPTSGLRSMTKSEAKNGQQQQQKQKPLVGQVLMGGFATREYDDGAMTYA